MDRNKQYDKMVTAFGNMDYNSALSRLLEVAVLEINAGYFEIDIEEKYFRNIYPDGAMPRSIVLNVLRCLRDILKLKDISILDVKDQFFKTESKLSKKAKYKVDPDVAWVHLVSSYEKIKSEPS